MFDALPDWIDPARLSARAGEVAGTLPLSRLPRLSGELLDTEGEASARFHFDRAPGGGDRVRGHVQATLHLRCQRCLERMDHPVDHDFEARLVADEKVLETLPDDQDAVWVEERGLSLHGLLEEELLLALPVVALHPEGSPCAEGGHREFADGDISRSRREVDNPFAVLKGLKADENKP